MDNLYIVIPAYNEEENIRRVLEDWYPVVERHTGRGGSRMVVVDDGSRDKTRNILEEFARTHPLLVPLTKKKRRTWRRHTVWISLCDSKRQSSAA